LFEIVDALCRFAAFTGAVECRQQYRRQNSDYRNNNQKFYKSKFPEYIRLC